MLPHEENPWTVENLEEFLYFCCPECDERNQSKELFVQHALDQHPNSKDSLIKFQVKKEPIEDNSNADSIQENPAFEMHGNPVFMDYYMSAENDNYDMVKCELKEEFDEDDIPDDDNLDSIPSNLQDEEIMKAVQRKISREKIKKSSADKIKKPKNCDSCKKTFPDSYSLKRHVTTVHEGIRKHKCESCQKEFGLRGNLIKHIRTVHEGLKNHVCDLCGKAYGRSNDLKKHISRFEQSLCQKTDFTVFET